MAFQLTGFQNLTTHGVKGFQEPGAAPAVAARNPAWALRRGRRRCLVAFLTLGFTLASWLC
jgi:hypothetical protein